MTLDDSAVRLLAAHSDMESGRYVQARAALEELVAFGEGKAALYLAWMEEQGLGGEPDLDAAVVRYSALSDSGDLKAGYQLAHLHLRLGEPSKALPLFVNSAQAGDASAAYWAALLYLGEGGHPIDNEQGIALLQVAAAGGHMLARRDLAKLRMLTGANLRSRMAGALAYFWAKARAVIILIRDVRSPRVR